MADIASSPEEQTFKNNYNGIALEIKHDLLAITNACISNLILSNDESDEFLFVEKGDAWKASKFLHILGDKIKQDPNVFITFLRHLKSSPVHEKFADKLSKLMCDHFGSQHLVRPHQFNLMFLGSTNCFFSEIGEKKTAVEARDHHAYLKLINI